VSSSLTLRRKRSMSLTETLRVLPCNKVYIKNVLVWNSTEANDITSEVNDITTKANDIPFCPRLVLPPPACQHEYCGCMPCIRPQMT
jgi:hypothetical protein